VPAGSTLLNSVALVFSDAWQPASNRPRALLRKRQSSGPASKTQAKIRKVELVRRRLLSEETRRNVDTLRVGIERRPALTFSTFLGYALSPLPSNYLFIAYGLTSLPIAFLSLPFFVGRLASYTFWITTASTIGDWLDVDVDWFESAPYFIAYYLISQLLLFPVIYVFTRIDWHALFAEGRLRWLERPKLTADSPPVAKVAGTDCP
jgi:hypothetical protein